MDKKHRKLHNEKGALTIEATIALTTFLFMFIMIYSIITIARAQAHIQVAINNTAKEISQYSYLYGMTGFDETLGAIQTSAEADKDEVDIFIGQIEGCFNGIQQLGETGESITGAQDALDKWETIQGQLDTVTDGGAEIKKQIQEMAKDPKALLFGLARIIGSEALEVGKSRLIAEPVAKALVQKHLKRTKDDTAEDFCSSVNIVPDTYILNDESCFNGLHFSNSTLFPYGSDEITIVVNYKIKMIQLIPVDFEMEITQSAVTKGWLHGDEGSYDSSIETRIKEFENTDSIWNTASLNERVDLIRNMGVRELVNNEGYSGISSETYIHAYNKSTKTFVSIASSNPLWGLSSVADVDRKLIQENLDRLAAQMESATENKSYVKLKENNSSGVSVNQYDLTGEQNLKVILVIPEDEGLKEIFEEVYLTLDTKVVFEFQPSYGKVFEEKKEDTTEGDS